MQARLGSAAYWLCPIMPSQISHLPPLITHSSLLHAVIVASLRDRVGEVHRILLLDEAIFLILIFHGCCLAHQHGDMLCSDSNQPTKGG
jgi:hypothetical protein